MLSVCSLPSPCPFILERLLSVSVEFLRHIKVLAYLLVAYLLAQKLLEFSRRHQQLVSKGPGLPLPLLGECTISPEIVKGLIPGMEEMMSQRVGDDLTDPPLIAEGGSNSDVVVHDHFVDPADKRNPNDFGTHPGCQPILFLTCRLVLTARNLPSRSFLLFVVSSRFLYWKEKRTHPEDAPIEGKASGCVLWSASGQWLAHTAPGR